MDFSLKQALGVVVVVAVAALVVITAIGLTRTNNTNASTSTNALWTQANSMISGEGAPSGGVTNTPNTNGGVSGS